MDLQSPNAFTTMKSRVPRQLKLTDDDFKPIEPTLIMDWLELDGPLVGSWPTAAHQRIFSSQDAREIITKFAERAWRRVDAGVDHRQATASAARTAEVVWEGFVVRRPLNPGTGNTDCRYSDLELLGDGTLARS